MTPHDFGMWGLAVGAWLFVAGSAAYGYALLKAEFNHRLIQRRLDEMMIEEIENEGGVTIEFIPEEDQK
jgi:hypothetical protein